MIKELMQCRWDEY